MPSRLFSMQEKQGLISLITLISMGEENQSVSLQKHYNGNPFSVRIYISSLRMKQQSLGTSNLNVSNISLGCMRMNHLALSDAQQVIQHAREAGINFFDHADIYGGGESERIFAEALQREPIQREDIYIQSKT